MTSRELNLKLTAFFPDISDAYYEEASWQDGDETGSHVIYADVFVPFIRKHIADKNETMLIKLFEFIESLLELNDEYVNEVISLSVLETLIFDDETENILFIKYAKSHTLELINEIIQNI